MISTNESDNNNTSRSMSSSGNNSSSYGVKNSSIRRRKNKNVTYSSLWDRAKKFDSEPMEDHGTLLLEPWARTNSNGRRGGGEWIWTSFLWQWWLGDRIKIESRINKVGISLYSEGWGHPTLDDRKFVPEPRKKDTWKVVILSYSTTSTYRTNIYALISRTRATTRPYSAWLAEQKALVEDFDILLRRQNRQVPRRPTWAKSACSEGP